MHREMPKRFQSECSCRKQGTLWILIDQGILYASFDGILLLLLLFFFRFSFCPPNNRMQRVNSIGFLSMKSAIFLPECKNSITFALRLRVMYLHLFVWSGECETFIANCAICYFKFPFMFREFHKQF